VLRDTACDVAPVFDNKISEVFEITPELLAPSLQSANQMRQKRY